MSGADPRPEGPSGASSGALAGASADVPYLVEHLFRHQAGQLLATLTRHLGPQHLDLAEDVVQETLLVALRRWPRDGVPANPTGWLLTVARHRALDALRRDARWRDRQPQLAALASPPLEVAAFAATALRDDLLTMLFICCHPVISPEAQVTLMLKTVGGFSGAEIARAFLAKETAIAQRLVRARRALQGVGVAFALPRDEELPHRLDAVLAALYLIFNEGYGATAGDVIVRTDLCVEAIRLLTLLTTHSAGDVPRAHALRALMLLQAARLPGRQDAAGDLLILAEQDRRVWNQPLLAAGMQALARAMTGETLSAYHLQAAIISCHASAASYAATDWPRILSYYDALLRLAPTPVTCLNRAVAVGMVAGPHAALATLAALPDAASLAAYPLYHATLATFQHQAGDPAGAAAAYRAALALPLTAPERRFLSRRLASCAVDGPPTAH